MPGWVGGTLRVLVPAYRVGGQTDFRYDAVTSFLRVTLIDGRPRLAVEEVWSVLSGDLSLPNKVTRRE